MNNHTIIVVNPDLKIEELVKTLLQRPEKQLILEVPERTTFLTNEINLRLIKFYAEDEDKELIINAVDPVLVSLAQRLGISTIRERNLDVTGHGQEVAATIPPAEPPVNPVPKKPRRTRPKRQRNHPWTAKGFLPAVVVAFCTLVLGIWLFVQPKAVIIVYPKEQKLNFSAKAEVGPDYREQDILAGKIPAKVVDKVAELTVQTATTGKKVIGITPATGKVILINRSTQPVVVPKGAIVIGNNGVRYQTGKNVLVPRKITRTRYGIPVGEEYGKVEVSVIAMEKGTLGNRPAKSISKIEGKYQKFLQVVNLEPLTNGSDQRLPVVAAADFQKGQTEAK
ncbi:MAG TPA: hypothetical protein VEC37_08315, partial [Bacillota bacterium]|nr:hypothetical protein [Bacillota bacterium]